MTQVLFSTKLKTRKKQTHARQNGSFRLGVSLFCHVIVLCISMQILFHGRMRILKIGKQIQRQKNSRHIFNCNNARHQITSVNCTPLATKKRSTGSTPIRFFPITSLGQLLVCQIILPSFSKGCHGTRRWE